MYWDKGESFQGSAVRGVEYGVVERDVTARLERTPLGFFSLNPDGGDGLLFGPFRRWRVGDEVVPVRSWTSSDFPVQGRGRSSAISKYPSSPEQNPTDLKPHHEPKNTNTFPVIRRTGRGRTKLRTRHGQRPSRRIELSGDFVELSGEWDGFLRGACFSVFGGSLFWALDVGEF